MTQPGPATATSSGRLRAGQQAVQLGGIAGGPGLGPDEHHGRTGTRHRVRQRWRRHPGAEQPDRHTALGQRGGQRLQWQGVLLLVGRGQQDPRRRAARRPGHRAERLGDAAGQQVLDLDEALGRLVAFADADQHRQDDFRPRRGRRRAGDDHLEDVADGRRRPAAWRPGPARGRLGRPGRRGWRGRRRRGCVAVSDVNGGEAEVVGRRWASAAPTPPPRPEPRPGR